MPVEAQTVEYSYVGDGVTTVFPFPSKFLSNDDIDVALNYVEQVSGYVVSGAGIEAGGSVTITPAPGVGSVVTLLRNPPMSQLLDFVNGQTILENTLDTGLDKLTMIVQYLKRLVSKTMRLSPFDPSTLNPLPNAAARANGLLGFDGTGQPKVYPDFSGPIAVFNLLGEIVSVYGTTSAALQQAGVAAANGNTPLNIDVPITLTGSFAPGFPNAPASYKFWPNGKLVQGGVGGVTFIAPIEAGRWPIFDGFIVNDAMNQLSLFPGADPIVEWFLWTGETEYRNALDRAVKSANNAVARIGVGNYGFTTDGQGSSIAVVCKRSQSGLVGPGRDRATLVDLSTYVDTGQNVAANSGLLFIGTDIPAGGSHIVNPKIGGFKLTRAGGIGVGGVGLALQYTARAELFDMQIEGYLVGMQLKRSTNAIIKDVHVHFPGPANHPVTGVPLAYVGLDFDGASTQPSPAGVALGNASSIGYRLAVSADNPNTASKGLHVHGGYSGDLHFEYFDTQGIGVGIHLDFTGAIPDTNGNADLIFDYLHLDGIKNVAMLVDGDVDGNSLWTVKSGWVNVSGGVGTIGYYIRNGKGGNLDLGQSGIGGRGAVYALKVEGHVGLVAVNGQLKDTKRAMWLNGAQRCDVGGGTLIRNVPAYPLEYGAFLDGGSSYNVVRIGAFTGSASSALVVIDAGANNYNEVIISKFDTSAMPTFSKHGQSYPFVVFIGAGATGNIIRYAGPDTHILDGGTDTLVWSDWTPYASVALTSTGGGAFADVTSTVSYRREGGVTRVRFTFVIGAAGVGAATGVPVMSLPVPPLVGTTAAQPVDGQGFIYTTASFPTNWKLMDLALYSGSARLYLRDGTSAILNSTTLEGEFTYKTANA